MIDQSKPVRVFKNPKRDCYNIMQNGRVKANAKQIWLKDAEFLVRESGRQRMLRERRKNIHAYIVGELLAYVQPEDEQMIERLEGRNATYNPFQYSSFVDCETEAPLKTAQMVQLDERGVTYC